MVEHHFCLILIVMENINVALVDDDQLILNLLEDYLNSVDSLTVLCTHSSSANFYQWLETNTPPAVLILDLRLKDESGQDIIDYIVPHYPEIKIIVLSSHYHPNFLGYIFKKGVHAFIPKEVLKDELVDVIQQVARNGHYLNAEQVDVLRKQIASNSPSIPKKDVDAITDREKEVLQLLCHQLTAKEIAERLFLSKKTVETHKSNLLLKTGAKNVAGLIIFATQHQLVKLDEIML